MKKVKLANPIISNSFQSLGISSKVIVLGFFKQISDYVDAEDVSIVDLVNSPMQTKKFDYLYLSYCNPIYFILRQQQKINLPFIIHIHILIGQLVDLTTIIPFLHPDDIIIAPSQFVVNGIKKIIKNFNNIVKVNFLLDIKEIQSKIRFNDIFKNRISFLGRIVEYKGIESVINILPKLKKKNSDISLDIIGPFSGEKDNNKESEFFKHLKRKAQQLKVDDNIKWHGAITSFEKYHILASTDIMINPSVYIGETFGVVNIEALACGLPVICTDWKPFDEFIENGVNGFRVRMDYQDLSKTYKVDEDELFNCIDNLLCDTSLLKKLKRNAWNQAKLEYDISHYNHEFISLLKCKTNKTDYSKNDLLDKSIEDNNTLYTANWIEYISALDVYKVKFKHLIQNIPSNRIHNLSEIIVNALKVIENNRYVYSLDNVLVQDIMSLNKYLSERNDEFLLDPNMITLLINYLKN